MKAVLMSIRPEYCEKIFNGEKTIEVRKRVPKLKPPFKVYVYCTQGPYQYLIDAHTNTTLNGFVIGEFECDLLVRVLDHPEVFAHHPLIHTKALEDACITQEEALKYSDSKDLFGLHISRPRLYDKPKELSRFIRPCPNNLYCESCATFSENRGRCFNAALQITRPPQSWMYVEEWDFQF